MKGCGNEEIGFNLKKRNTYFNQYNTRGSQYNCTCFRELYFSDKVQKALEKVGIPCANLPVGFWKYDRNLFILPNESIKSEEIPILENQIPEIDKYCSIFRTIGERRLRTHLLLGIEKILGNISKLCISKRLVNQDVLNEIKKIFPEKRFPNKFPTYLATSSPFFSESNMNFDEWCSKPVYTQNYYDSIISCKKLKKEIKENKNLKIFLDASEKYEELYPLMIDGLSDKHKNIIRKIIDKLIIAQKTGKKFFRSLIDIYARIGYETSRVKKCLQEAHINWGTYIDREVDVHCNAHANNFIILPQGNNSLLAPLDFDLAYSKDKMIILAKNSDSFGKHDDSLWDNYINIEFTHLSGNLCGAEDYNSESEKKRFTQNTFDAEIRNTFKYILYDCLYENYMKGFDSIPSDDVINNEQLKEDSFLHNIVKLALTLTLDDVA